MTSKGTAAQPVQISYPSTPRARVHTHTHHTPHTYTRYSSVWVRAHGEENARVGRGIGSQWSTFLGKAVRVLAARAVTALTTRLSFQYDPRESGKRSNELQNCNAITAITNSSQLHDRSFQRQFILKLQHLEMLAQVSIGTIDNFLLLISLRASLSLPNV